MLRSNTPLAHFLFDASIAAFLLLDGVLIYRYIPTSMDSFRGVGIFGLLVLAWLVIFYGSFIEPRIVRIKQTRANMRSATGKKNATVRLVLVSDIHVGPYKGTHFVKRLVESIQKQKPDIIVLTGDFICDTADEIPLLEPLKNLNAPLGVFGVLGNHDYGVEPNGELWHGAHQGPAVAEALKKWGVEIFKNEGAVIRDGNSKTPQVLFTLLGLDEWWMKRANIGEALQSANNTAAVQAPLIILTHNADAIQLVKKIPGRRTLFLAGHTHGGQIRLPMLGSVPRIPHTLGNHYDRGWFKVSPDADLFITSGAGESGPRARLLVPPEIVVMEVTL